MQAAMNPLLSLLNPGASGGASAVPEVGAAARYAFQSLLTSSEMPNETVNLSGTVPNWLNQALPQLEALVESLGDLATLAESGELPSELTEIIEDGLASLPQLLQLVKSDASEGLQNLRLSEFKLEFDEIETLSPLAPQAVFQSIHETVQALAANIAAFDATGEFVAPAQLSHLLATSASLQGLVRPAAPGQHPVAVASAIEAGPAANVPNAPVSIIETATLPNAPEEAHAALTSSQVDFIDASIEVDDGVSFYAAGLNRASLVSSSNGLIEIPREMVQVAPQEMNAIVQAAREILEPSAQVQSAQSARPDAPQAKFSQAVVGQLRSVDFQEGTTKVELNPRGLGSIEVEMKTNTDGSLSVVVRAENAHVLSSLREERDLLGQIIGQSGDASVAFEEFGSGEQQKFEQEQGHDGTVSGGSVATKDDVDEQQVTIGNGQLDLMT